MKMHCQISSGPGGDQFEYKKKNALAGTLQQSLYL